jgi:hypothetical protein
MGRHRFGETNSLKSSELLMVETVCKSTRRYIPDERHWHFQRREGLICQEQVMFVSLEAR